MLGITKSSSVGTVDKARAGFETIREQLRAANVRLEQERAVYAEALAAITGDTADIGNVRKAHARLATAESDTAATRDALQAAQERLAAAEAAAVRIAKAAAYDAAHALFVKRASVAEKITAKFAEMAALKAELDSLTDQGRNTLPLVPDPDAAVLRSQQIDGLMAQERMRVGLALKTGLRPLHEIEPFHVRFAETPDLIKRWKQTAIGN